MASKVFKVVGEVSDVNTAAHYTTRLRLVLADRSEVDQTALDAVDDLKETFTAGGMFQIIAGPGDVDVVYQRVVSNRGVCEVSKDEAKEEAGQDGSLFSRFIKTIADIFVPVLPALIADGFMIVLNNILQAGFFNGKLIIDMYPTVTDYASLINLVSAAAFAFLPILVSLSATRRFGDSIYLGAAIGAVMVSGSLLSVYSMTDQDAADVFQTFTGTNPTRHLFGLEVDKIGCRAIVIPVLYVTWILSTIEKWLHKRPSSTADFLLTPLITMLVTGFLIFVLAGPVTRQLSVLLTNGLDWIYNTLGVLSSSIFGFFYNPVVIIGLHQSLPAMEISPLPQNGGPGDFTFPIAPMANVVQGITTLAVSAKTRDTKLRGLTGAGGTSAVFSITGPAISGVNLRLRQPFFVNIGATAIDSVGVILLNVRGAALGVAGFVNFVSIRTADIPEYLLLEVIVFVFSFGATFVCGSTRGKADMKARPATIGDASAVPVQVPESTAIPVTAGTIDRAAAPALATAPAPKPAIISGATDYSVTAPLDDQVVPLEQVKDESFARGMLDPGIATAPAGGQVAPPVDGEVIVAFTTGYAYDLRTASDVQTLVHIGMDTVELKGKGFTPRVARGDMVRRDDVLVEVDWDVAREAGYDTITPIAVTSKKELEAVTPVASDCVSFEDVIVEVTPEA